MTDFEVPVLIVPDTPYSLKIPTIVDMNLIRICQGLFKDQCGDRFLQRAHLSIPWHIAYQHLSARDRFLGENCHLGLVKVTDNNG